MKKRIIKLQHVIADTGLARSTLYKKVKEGDFPKPIKLGVNARATGWLEHEVQNWIDEQISANRGCVE